MGKQCENVGRNYDDIHRTIMLNCSIAETYEQAYQRAQAANFARNVGGPENLRTRSLVGTPETIRKRLTEYEQIGAQEATLFFPAPHRRESLRLFAKDVMGK